MIAAVRPLLLLVVVCGLSAGEDPPYTAGQVFAFAPDLPKYIDTSLEFHDASGVKWPMYFYGRPLSGSFTADAREPKAAFSLTCDRMAQPNGTQDRKILGELVGDKPPAITVNVLSLGPLIDGERDVPGRDGKIERKKYAYFPAKAELDIAGKKLPMSGEATVRYEGKPATIANLTLRFLITGKDIGLKAPGCAGPITLTVYAGAAMPGAGKKK